MPYSKQTWTDNVTVVDKTHMDHLEDGLVALDTGKVTFAYGTTLPGSPVDGQIAILVDSTTNPTYQWQFRWNAGSSSAYKWEFVGGATAYVAVATLETVTSANTWTDVATVGPLLVLPRAGDYDAIAETQWNTAPATVLAVAGLANGAATPPLSHATLIPPSSNDSITTANLFTGCAAASDIRLRYWANTVSAINAQNRWLRVTPVRVA